MTVEFDIVLESLNPPLRIVIDRIVIVEDELRFMTDGEVMWMQKIEGLPSTWQPRKDTS